MICSTMWESCTTKILQTPILFISQDDYGDEREANMAAVIAAAKMWKKENIVCINY